MRLIDADALEGAKFHSIEDWTPVERASWQWGWNDAIDAIISSAPTVDPAKHGHWEVVDAAEPRRWGCSNCRCLSWHEFYYCPSCGAKMDEVET